MAEYISSGGNLEQNRLKNFFLPSPLVWVYYTFISLIILALLNFSALWQVFLGHSVGSISVHDITSLADRFSSFQSKLSTPVVMLVWVLIGGVTYTIIWLLESAFFITKKEVDESHYLQGGLSPQNKYWKSALASNAFLVLIAIVGIGFIALYLMLLLPVFAQSFHRGLYVTSISERILDIAIGILGNAIAIHVFLLTRRALTRTWQLNRPTDV